MTSKVLLIILLKKTSNNKASDEEDNAIEKQKRERERVKKVKSTDRKREILSLRSFLIDQFM